MSRALFRASVFSEGYEQMPSGALLSSEDQLYKCKTEFGYRPEHHHKTESISRQYTVGMTTSPVEMKPSCSLPPMGYDLLFSVFDQFYKTTNEICANQPQKCPSQEEKAFYEKVRTFVPRGEEYVLIAISDGTDTDTLRHEILHAEFFLNPRYQAAVKEFWEYELSEDDRNLIRQSLSPTYDINDEILLLNEFQAYTLESGPFVPGNRIGVARRAWQDDLKDYLAAALGKTPVGSLPEVAERILTIENRN